jgi:uncharacterized protein YgbK (DUF1537 family)
MVVAGSRHQATIRQLEIAETCLGLPIVLVQPDEHVSPQGKLVKLNQLAKEAANLINCGRSVIIASAQSRYAPALKEASARVLARLAARAIKQSDPTGLFLTGGDIARETCHALAVSGIRIFEELEPGVAAGKIIGGHKEGLWVVTKAGGLGGDEAIASAIHYLQGKEKWKRKEDQYWA